VLPLGEFLLGNRRTALAPDELLTAVLVPAPATGEVSAFLKLGARAYLVISIVSVAVNAVLSGGKIASARIAFGAASAAPVRDHALEAMVAGLTPEGAAARLAGEAASSLSPIDDVRASAAFRRDAAVTLAARALASLSEQRIAA
jgi:CO/xanthine dehydrogenase FAD-binding subunit